MYQTQNPVLVLLNTSPPGLATLSVCASQTRYSTGPNLLLLLEQAHATGFHPALPVLTTLQPACIQTRQKGNRCALEPTKAAQHQ